MDWPSIPVSTTSDVMMLVGKRSQSGGAFINPWKWQTRGPAQSM